MRKKLEHGESGQASSEYSIVLGMIALVCIAAAVLVGVALKDHFGASSEPVRRAPFVPPRSSPAPVWPTTIEQCEDGEWRAFPQFRNEEECREYVESLTP